MSERDYWPDLVRVYFKTKALLILAEEIDPDMKTLPAPLLQLRDALDHIMRAKGSEIGLLEKPDDHGNKNMDKALGHVYRAYFDIADWVAASLRKKASDAVKRFSTECLAAVTPQYYQEWKPGLERVAHRVAAIRTSKDIGDPNGIINEVEEYDRLIKGLIDTWENIEKSIPALDDWRRRRNREGRRRSYKSILLRIAFALAFGAGGFWLKTFLSRSSN